MGDFDILLAQIDSTIDLASSLIQNPDDNYTACVAALNEARAALTAGIDKSADCLCPCHKDRPDWHALPCGCYSGNPYLVQQ